MAVKKLLKRKAILWIFLILEYTPKFKVEKIF